MYMHKINGMVFESFVNLLLVMSDLIIDLT